MYLILVIYCYWVVIPDDNEFFFTFINCNKLYTELTEWNLQYGVAMI